jgi:photosystem II protein
MSVEIQVFPGIKEESFPIIKVTKSTNGKTGTATFLFIQPTSLNFFFLQNKPIESVFLIKDQKKIKTKDITLYFKEGKPFLLKTIFLFKNSDEWFAFLNFMSDYSKEKGFLFES